MPPVGQKRTSPNGPPRALIAGAPPEVSAGKNLKWLRPASRPRIRSEALAIPGSSGTGLWAAAANRLSVRPGLTMKRAPASTAWSYWRPFSTVPAPITASGTSAAMAAMASRAQAVRRVTSTA